MTKPDDSTYWVVVAAYNEDQYLDRVLSKLRRYSQRIIVVDDGSVDKSSEVAQKYATYVLKHKINLGKGAALKTACDFAFYTLKAGAVIMLDADDQHDPSELPLFIQALNEGNQVVFGARQEPRNMPWLRLKVNRFSSFITALLFGAYIQDIPSGYKAFTSQAYQKLRWEAADYSVELEIAARTAKYKLLFTQVSIKTIYHDLTKGMTALDVVPALWYILKLRIIL